MRALALVSYPYDHIEIEVESTSQGLSSASFRQVLDCSYEQYEHIAETSFVFNK